MSTFYERKLEEIRDRWKRHPERLKLFTEQYLRWGFSDEDTFDLSAHLTELILPRLKRFKEVAKIKIDFPLDDMIRAFQLYKDVGYDRWQLRGKEWKDFKKGMKAFAEHFLALWW